jgi:hypothetical protein
MKSKSIGAVALLFLMMSSELALAQDMASQLIGVWRQTSIVRKYVETGEMVNRQGPGGVTMFVRGGFFAHRNDPAQFFGSGTYKAESDVVVLRYQVSSDASWIGQERRVTMRIVVRSDLDKPPFKDFEVGHNLSSRWTNG